MNLQDPLNELLPVALGGFCGAIARYLIGIALTSPVNTFCVNITGSFILGGLMYYTEYAGYVNQRTRLFLGIGFLGSLTTFSTFAVESFKLEGTKALLNISSNVLLALFAIYLSRSMIILIRNWRSHHANS